MLKSLWSSWRSCSCQMQFSILLVYGLGSISSFLHCLPPFLPLMINLCVCVFFSAKKITEPWHGRSCQGKHANVWSIPSAVFISSWSRVSLESGSCQQSEEISSLCFFYFFKDTFSAVQCTRKACLSGCSRLCHFPFQVLLNHFVTHPAFINRWQEKIR